MTLPLIGSGGGAYLGLGVVNGSEEVAPLGALDVADTLEEVLRRRVGPAGHLAELTDRHLQTDRHTSDTYRYTGTGRLAVERETRDQQTRRAWRNVPPSTCNVCSLAHGESDVICRKLSVGRITIKMFVSTSFSSDYQRGTVEAWTVSAVRRATVRLTGHWHGPAGRHVSSAGSRPGQAPQADTADSRAPTDGLTSLAGRDATPPTSTDNTRIGNQPVHVENST